MTAQLVRRPAVAGTFYPAEPKALRSLVDELLEAAGNGVAQARGGPSGLGAPGAGAGSGARDQGAPGGPPGQGGLLAGILVPHAGLLYSGLVAAHAWRLLGADPPATVVLLGTNHRAAWLRGIAAWDAGPWLTPLGSVAIDLDLARTIAGLGAGFGSDPAAHEEEHSLEVQLPFLQVVAPGARIVPLAVSTGTGPAARDAGERLGRLIAERRSGGERIVLVASSDAAHYPAARDAARVNDVLAPALMAVDPVDLAERDAGLVASGIPGLACGMCGIEPSVVGLAALRAMGVVQGELLAAATSADAGGDPWRTVGYLAAAFRA